MNKKQKDLILAAEQFLNSDGKYLYPSSKGIIKSGIKQAKEKGDFSDLNEWLPKMKKNAIRLKDEEKAKEKKDCEDRVYRMKQIVDVQDKKEIQKEIAKMEKLSHEYMEKHNKLRLDERTQRRFNLVNKIEGNAKRMELMKDTLNNYDKLKDNKIKCKK